ncbi:MAG: sigma-70 family RNA polymerase sigma factor, partial [Planctomycetota bacterium]
MSDAPSRPQVEDLLRQSGWIEKIAVGLVQDRDIAADVVQEARIAMLRGQADDVRSPRSWLIGLVRNLSHQWKRHEVRRERRERISAQSDELPSTAELAERMETQRLLATAILELPDSLRDAIVLRYFEDLSAAEIARRQGIPAATVRSRLKRGLDQLRIRLDRHFGGDEQKWISAIVACIPAKSLGVAAAGTVIVPGVIVMKQVGQVLAVVLLATAVGVGLWSLAKDTDEAPTERIGSVPTPSVASGDEAVVPGVSGSTSGNAEDSARQLVPDTHLSIDVRVVDRKSGEPLAGVPIRFTAKDESSNYCYDAVSGIAGAFRFEDVPPEKLVLETRPAGDVEYACDPVQIDLTVKSSGSTDLLVEKRWFLAGIVVEAGSSRPVRNFPLTARLSELTRVSLGATDGEGRFRSRNGFAAGWWTIEQSPYSMWGLDTGGMVSHELARVHVGTDDSTHLLIENGWTGTLLGRVLDPSGSPIRDATIRALGADSPRYYRHPGRRWWARYELMKSDGLVAKTDLHGRFALQHLPEDRAFQLVVSAEGFVTTPTDLLDPPFPENRQELEIRLPHGGKIVGEVLDTSGSPLAEATVIARVELPLHVQNADKWRHRVLLRIVAENKTYGNKPEGNTQCKPTPYYAT